jgi:Mg-chelatase subunit ChlD
MKAWLGWIVALSLLSGCRVQARGRAAAPVPRFTASGNIRVTVDAWARISTTSGAVAVTSKGAEDVPDLMRQINEEALPEGEAVDVVYVVDTTGSMGDDIDAAKRQMHDILADLTARNPDRRVGVVAYRDREDVYTARVVLFLDVDPERIARAIDSLRVTGGGDVPEHVYAGLDMALREQPWRRGASHHIVLIGDAPPHEDYADDPRNYQNVMAEAARPELAVKIHTIGVYCDAGCRKALTEELGP